MYHILIVEDDDEINKLLSDFLTKNGYSVTSRYDGLHVLDCLKEHKVDLILLDLMLPYRSGDLHRRHPKAVHGSRNCDICKGDDSE